MRNKWAVKNKRNYKESKGTFSIQESGQVFFGKKRLLNWTLDQTNMQMMTKQDFLKNLANEEKPH